MSFPATIEIRTPERIDRWRPLVQWVLAIPHLVIARAMEYVACALALVSWFAILVTKRMPAGIAHLQVLILRYSSRAHVYAGFLHDRYPPFEFSSTWDEPGGTPVDIGVDPDLDDRDRWTVALRLLWIVPILLFGVLVTIVGLLAWMVGFVAIVVTGRWPARPLSWVVGLQRVWLRVQAYGLLLTDEYPEFTTR